MRRFAGAFLDVVRQNDSRSGICPFVSGRRHASRISRAWSRHLSDASEVPCTRFQNLAHGSKLSFEMLAAARSVAVMTSNAGIGSRNDWRIVSRRLRSGLKTLSPRQPSSELNRNSLGEGSSGNANRSDDFASSLLHYPLLQQVARDHSPKPRVWD